MAARNRNRVRNRRHLDIAAFLFAVLSRKAKPKPIVCCHCQRWHHPSKVCEQERWLKWLGR